VSENTLGALGPEWITRRPSLKRLWPLQEVLYTSTRSHYLDESERVKECISKRGHTCTDAQYRNEHVAKEISKLGQELTHAYRKYVEGGRVNRVWGTVGKYSTKSGR
jgi:hypothetical protein